MSQETFADSRLALHTVPWLARLLRPGCALQGLPVPRSLSAGSLGQLDFKRANTWREDSAQWIALTGPR